MLQNKIYQNFISEILKIFAVVLFALSIIALTVRAVNFLDLIVENGYPISTYFKYSILNLIGIVPKFIPFSFLIALTIFIIKHLDNNEFLILWTTGIKKIYLVNIFIITSILVLFLYLTFSAILAPYSLNKSRQLLSQDNLNSILPTLKTQQFNDSFKGLIFFIEKKVGNEISKVFVQDRGNHFRSLSSNISESSLANIVAEKGIVNKKNIILLNGQIISSKKNDENEIIKFDQLNIDLGNINTTNIKSPKIQETSTISLLNCIIKNDLTGTNCKATEEIISSLNRRLILPFYIPVIALLCSMLLIKSKKKLLNKSIIFIYSFILLVFIELIVRYTGLNYFLRYLFFILPFILIFIFYIFILFNFKNETNKK